MSKILATIEGCQVVLGTDGKIHYTAKAAIDNDGSGGNPEHDPDFQSDTSLHHNGKALNSETEKFIVVPPAIVQGVPGIILGCQAFVTNTKNGRFSAAVCGDIGPRAKLGEISVALAKALGINPSPNTGGEDAHVIEYTIEPGVPAVVEGEHYSLQRS